MSDRNAEVTAGGEDAAQRAISAEPTRALAPGEASKKAAAEDAGGGNAEATSEGENAEQQLIPTEPNHHHVPGGANRDNNGEVDAGGEEAAHKPTSSEPAHSRASGEAEKGNKAEAASGDNSAAAAEDEKPERQSASPNPKPGPSPAVAGVKEETNTEVASGDDGGAIVVGEKPVGRPTFGEPGRPLGPGKIKKINHPETASGDNAAIEGARAAPPPTFPKSARSLASEEGVRAREERLRHRLFSLAHVLVEFGLFLATGWLVYATYQLVVVTRELSKVTSDLASVTGEEVHANKGHASSLEKRAKEINSHLATLGVKVEGLNHVFPGANPPKWTIGDDFNCDVSKDGGKWVLRKADLCPYLRVPIKSPESLQFRIEFSRDSGSWECPLTGSGDSGGAMTADLMSCFEKYHQERRGELDFMVKGDKREER